MKSYRSIPLLLLILVLLMVCIGRYPSAGRKETLYFADELAYASQTTFEHKKLSFRINPSPRNGKEHKSFIQSGPGGISFFISLKRNPRLQLRFTTDSGKEAVPGALVTVESDFPETQKRVQAVTENRSTVMDLTEFQDRIVKVTFLVDSRSEFANQRFHWIDPRVEQQYISSSYPPNSLKEFRMRHSGDNVLIFLFDAVNVLHVGCYGSVTGATPVIDSVAAESVVWDYAFTPAVYTIASTGSLFTGLHPMQHGVLVNKDSLPETFTTMAEVFQSAGYETGLFSATGYASPVFGYGQGFKTLWIPKGPIINASEFVPVVTDWLKRSKYRPFFGYIHFREPHFPFQPPEEFLSRFHTDLNFQLPITDNSIVRSDDEKRKIVAAYDANLAYADQQFGRILAFLRSSGLYERTILILLSDHGEAFGEHGMQGHNASVYEEMIRIPLVIRIPREPALKGIRRSQIVENTSLFPTLLDLFSFPAKQIQPMNKSLLPVLLGNGEPPEPMLFSQTAGRGSYGIRTSRFKFIERRPERYQDELYDLKTDPFERNNLIEKYFILSGYYKTVFQKRYREWEKSLLFLETVKRKAVIDKDTEEQLRALGYIN